MLNSGKKIGALRDKKKNIRTLVFLNETNNHNTPLQVKWSVPYHRPIRLCLDDTGSFVYCNIVDMCKLEI